MTIALNDLSPDKQWDIARWRSIRGQLEDWATLGIVVAIALSLRLAPTQLPNQIPQSSEPESPNYGLFTDYLIDDSPPNSWDYTMYDRVTDSEYVPTPSPCNGKISDTRTDDPGGYGKYVEVQCGNSEYWFFAHLDSVEVEVGQVVQKGESIGVQGTSGNSTGVHIHLEIASTSGGTAIAREQSRPLVDDYLAWLEGGAS